VARSIQHAVSARLWRRRSSLIIIGSTGSVLSLALRWLRVSTTLSSSSTMSRSIPGRTRRAGISMQMIGCEGMDQYGKTGHTDLTRYIMVADDAGRTAATFLELGNNVSQCGKQERRIHQVYRVKVMDMSIKNESKIISYRFYVIFLCGYFHMVPVTNGCKLDRSEVIMARALRSYQALEDVASDVEYLAIQGKSNTGGLDHQ